MARLQKSKLMHRVEHTALLQGMYAKVELAKRINELLNNFSLSQLDAAQRLGMPQSKISAIRNYKLHGISLERLMQALVSLDQHVEIVVKPKTARANSITVAA